MSLQHHHSAPPPMAPPPAAADVPLRILIVDDEESILWSLSQNLSFSSGGFSVGTAGSAEEALEIIRSTKVDVLISDLKLPNMNGLELMKAVRAISPQTRSILMTAYGNNSVVDRASQEGFIAYLEKPFSIDLLLNYINGPSKPTLKVSAELLDLELMDLLEFYTSRPGNAVIRISAEAGAGLLVIKEGNLVHAEFDTTEGVEALASIIYVGRAALATLPAETARTVLESTIPTLNLTRADIAAIRKSDAPIETTRILRGQAHTAPEPAVPHHAATAPILHKNPSAVFRPVAEVAKTLHNRPRSSADSNRIAMILQAEQPTSDEPRISLDESAENDLALAPDPLDPESTTDNLSPKDRQLAVRNLITSGIENFKLHNLEQAKKCWLLALRLDPESPQAKKNLAILETTLLKTKTRK